MSRAALAILSTENLLHNLEVIQRTTPQSRVIAMIKANGYGHGLRSTAMRLEKYVHSFGVASIDEALALRKVNIKIPITLMEGVFEPNELLIAACENFHVVFHEQSQLEWIKTASLPCPLTAWLKVDTGMGRLGFTLDRAQDAYAQLSAHPQINQPIGIMSHFGCSDEINHPLNQMQINNFTNFIAGKPGIKSFCNSAAIFSFHPSIRPSTTLGATQGERYYDVIRPGIALYGVSPFSNISAEQLGLKPVMTLHTRLMAVRDVRKGSSLGYGARFICPNDMRIGVIAMGYGDGYPRTARDGTPILVNGVRCPLVGRVSMDMITVDVTQCPNPQVNDPVVLWGNGLPIEEVSQYTQQCPYDMLTAVQSRVKFHWTLAV
jgi:alanine racemase